MELTPELVGAVAGTFAAVLSGLTLAISVHRDERRWRREALTDVLVTMLESSFRGVRSDIFDPEVHESIDKYEQHAIDSHASLVNSMTRLRMLARANVVQKAEELHEVLDDMYDLVYKPEKRLIVQTFDELIKERERLRNDFVRLARKNLGLRGPAPITVGVIKGGPSMRDITKEVPEMRLRIAQETS